LSQVQSSPQLLARERRAFVWRKLHSLTGVVPVGVFLVLHLWTNARALGGQQAFEEAWSDSARLPYRPFLEVLGIGVPLLLHVVVGIKILFEMRPNLRRYPTGGNVAYVLQRVCGVIALAFIGYHLWQLRIQAVLGRLDPSDFFPTLCASLSGTVGPGLPLAAIVYLVGIAAVVFHLANGLHGFCCSWGITTSRRAARLTSACFGIIGILLFVVGANTVVYFATGTRLLFSKGADPTDPPVTSCRDLRPAGTGPGATAMTPAARGAVP
jgi:succinate dehydrogenase/fumarate reductase cytochrome b subunit (b558 family)